MLTLPLLQEVLPLSCIAIPIVAESIFGYILNKIEISLIQIMPHSGKMPRGQCRA